MDSIIARPTNSVRVIVVAASGCCASELNAVATARPSPSAGPILPKAIVMPAVTIEATAMTVMLSIICPLFVRLLGGFRFRVARACGRRDVNCGEDEEDIGLN